MIILTSIRICPKCKKPALKNAFNVSAWLAPTMYECTNCDYVGAIAIEIDPNDYEIDEEENVGFKEESGD